MTRRAALVLLATAWLVAGGVSASARTALDEVFPDGLPFPFARVLERLRAEAGPDAVRTALIPLGRSLQRHSAAPDYFSSPRVVVAVSDDRAQGPDEPRLADRLYLGYVPAAAVVEAISYDEAAGRFEFQEIVGYGQDAVWRTGDADRSICLRCHQGEGPIFARPLWSESNANPAIAVRLDGLGAIFDGVPVHQSVDALDAFDASTDRAARIAVANRLWAEGCADAACRAGLFVAALRYGLNGALPGWRAGQSPPAAAFDERAGTLWPDGLAVVSPDLPNRDPAAALGRAAPESLSEAAGSLDPETPRAPLVLWRPGTKVFGAKGFGAKGFGADGFDAAARAIAAMLSPADVAWLDELLQARKASGRPLSLGCEVGTASFGGGTEIRFDCGGPDGHAAGFLRSDGSGRIDRMTIGGAEVPARIPVSTAEVDGIHRIQATGPAPRLPDGARIAALEFDGAVLRLEAIDDVAPLATALQARARDGAAAFGPGPFRRRSLLSLVAEVLGAGNG